MKKNDIIANANPNPFNNQALTSFWTNGPQMSLTALQRARLVQEGLATITNFEDFDKDTLNDAFKNMNFSQPRNPDTVPPVLPVVDVPLSVK